MAQLFGLNMQTRQELRQQINESFTIDELQTLCSDLGVDPEAIPGKAGGKPYYAGQLVSYFETRGLVPTLLVALRVARPHIDWSYTPTLPSATSVVTPTKLPILKRWWPVIVVLVFILAGVFYSLFLRQSSVGLLAKADPVDVGETTPLSNEALGRAVSVWVDYGCVVLLSDPVKNDDQLRICQATREIPADWQKKTRRVGIDCKSRSAKTVHAIIYGRPDFEDKVWEFQFGGC